MVIHNVFGLNSITREPKPRTSLLTRTMTGISRQIARVFCAMHGHLILLHFEPNKLSLQCGLCGYESEGWEVGRPLVARRASDIRSRPYVHKHQVDRERRGTLRVVPSADAARWAS